MVSQLNNFIVYNAPAGSGKTTTIKKIVKEFQVSNPDKNVMCITYTNRAADELIGKINNKRVFCSTIHGCLNYLFKPYFKHSKIIELYLDVFNETINNRIENINQDTKIELSNNKYKEKYGDLSFELIHQNLKEITYGEVPFSSYYYGVLSHDDLLIFCNEIIKKFPKIRSKIYLKYKLIFIDEYQDTSSEVLNLFYEALKNTDTTLYLMGDKMQQIYNNYNGGFDDKLALCKQKSLQTNYRSSSEIVDILNKIYNNPQYNQTSFSGSYGDLPKIILYKDNIKEKLEEIKKDNPDLLVLYLLNSNKYNEIGAYDLYSKVNKMDKYKFGSKYSANDILGDNSIDNPDKLFRLLFLTCEIVNLFKCNQIGKLIHLIKNNKSFKNKNISLKNHCDKKIVFENLNALAKEFESDISIEEFLNYLVENNWINDINLILEEIDYNDVIKVKLKELINIDVFLKDPLISTQHGVKGESHDTVAFVSSDSQNLNVKMKEFFMLFSDGQISLTELECFEKTYKELLDSIKIEVAVNKISDLKANQFKEHHSKISSMINKFSENNIDNIYYKVLLEKNFNHYIEKNNVTNLTKAIKENNLTGVITAYKLFYVGCSRAKKKLYVYINEDMIEVFKDKFIEKMKNIGFYIID